jgi:hypothetical protein
LPLHAHGNLVRNDAPTDRSQDHRSPADGWAATAGKVLGTANLDKVRGLGAPVASIGGAGTFDGIFLTGILAVLLASLYTPRPAH